MPPKKKARTKSKSDDELERLVRWLSRDQLENFVMGAVRNNAIPISHLWKAVPERAAIEIRKTDAPVSTGNDRVGTGLFDLLDQNVTRHIFSYCGLLTKITCVTSVCKAWRGYKTIPGLFTDLSEHLAASRTASMYNRAFFLSALLRFVPDCSTVEAIRMATSKNDDHNYCIFIFKYLAAIKSEALEKGTPFHLKKLVIQGEKWSPTVMTRLGASGICSSLTTLIFEEVDGSKKIGKEDSIPNLLKLCPNLEELAIPQSLMSERNLSFHVSALSLARGAAPPLLKVLDLRGSGGWDPMNALSWDTLSKLGRQLPYLEVLRMRAISGTPVQSAEHANGFTPASPSLPNFLTEPFEPMPKVKVFQLNQLIPSWDYRFEFTPRCVPTPYLTKILMRLMEAMPELEAFFLGHGSYYVSKKKKGRTILAPLPKFQLSMTDLPQPRKLRKLYLYEVTVEPNDFMDLDVSSFEIIDFRCCGPGMAATIELLHQQAPHLTRTTETNRYNEVVAYRLSRGTLRGESAAQLHNRIG